jgi:hypothetical protein
MSARGSTAGLARDARNALVAALLGLAACRHPGDAAHDEAVAAYRSGRFDAAHAAFAALLAGAVDPSPELLHDAALAALRVHRHADADAAAARLAGTEPAASAFLRGHAAWLACERAAAAARLVDAEPGAFETARQKASAAAGHWQDAAAARAPWPEAIRNAERALRRDGALRREQEAAARRRPPPKQEPDPPAPPAAKPEQEPLPEPPGMTRTELSPEQVAKVLERLQQKENEKRRSRLAEQRAAAAVGERGW